MKYNLVSSKRLIAKVYRDFHPSNNAWVIDAIEWIGEGLQFIGYNVGYTRKPIKVHIVDYKGIVPCVVEEILAVEYNGIKLPLLQSLNRTRGNGYEPNTVGNWYSLNSNAKDDGKAIIETSFEEGCIILHAQILPLDKFGYPMIPDAAKVLEGLSWLILARMIGQGYKHHTFSYVDAIKMWEKWSMKGKNELNSPTLDQMELFKDRWTTMCNSYREEKLLFNQLTDTSIITDDEFFPMTQDNRTIVHVYEEDDDLELSNP